MRAGLRYCDNHVVMKFFSKYLLYTSKRKQTLQQQMENTKEM